MDYTDVGAVLSSAAFIDARDGGVVLASSVFMHSQDNEVYHLVNVIIYV